MYESTITESFPNLFFKMGGGGTLFGEVYYLRSTSSTIVFVAVLIVFFLFEGLLHVFEVECNKRGLQGLVKKLSEFMIIDETRLI